MAEEAEISEPGGDEQENAAPAEEPAPESEPAPEGEPAPADPPTPPASEPPPPPPEDHSAPKLEEARAWSGYKLDELGGATVARIEGVYVDDTSSTPTWLLIRLGRFGHHSLVPARDAVSAGERVWVPYDREVIRRGPRVKPGVAINKEQESTLLVHYGISAKAGRAGEIADRPSEAITSKPA